MAKKKLQNIAVRTVNNGYILTVGTIDYMAFNIEQLVNIFFVHVAVGKKEYIDQDIADALIEAAATWKDKGQLTEAVARWMSTARKEMRKEQAATKGMINANLRAEQLEDEVEQLKKENADLRAEIVKLKKLGTVLVGGHHDVIIDEPKKKSDHKIRKIDLVDDTKIAKRRGRKPGSGKSG